MNQEKRRTARAAVLFLAAYIIGWSVYLLFDFLQPVPAAVRGTAADPATFMPRSIWEQSRAYTLLRDMLFFISYAAEWAFFFLLLLTGTPARWEAAIKQRFRRPALSFPLFIALVTAAAFLWSLPIRIVSYIAARGYGISVQPAVSWARDQAVGLAVHGATMIVAAAAMFLLIRKVRRWWLSLWLLSVPFLLFMMYIQPVIIDPLFNTYEPLADERLKRDILELTDRAGIPAEQVYEVNLSEKTNAINAYVDGIGASLRIVVWDTALQTLTEDELLFLMAHEIGHYSMHHLEWSAVGSILFSFVFIAFGAWLFTTVIRRWGRELHVYSASVWSAWPLMLLIASLLTFLSLPAANLVSRQAERAADRYAWELLQSTDGAITLYQKLAVSSKNFSDKPLLVEWFRSTHPSIPERIGTIERVTQEMKWRDGDNER